MYIIYIIFVFLLHSFLYFIFEKLNFLKDLRPRFLLKSKFSNSTYQQVYGINLKENQDI